MSAKDVRREVANGHRLPKPKECPEAIYEIMQICWSEEPSDRPKFSALADHFKESQNDGKHKHYLTEKQILKTVHK